MMTQAFYTGVSGIKSANTGIEVLSNNLANVSTVGYRSYNTEFASLFEDSKATTSLSSTTVGLGTRAQASSMSQEQGALSLSDRSTDLAISGDGWFGIVNDGEPLYTRDGSFGFDANSDLITEDGFHLLGTMGNNISNGTLTEPLDEVKLGEVDAQETLQFPQTLTYPATATTTSKFIANVGSGEDGEAITVSATVIDNESNKNHLRLEFTKSEVQTPPGTQWNVTATTQSTDGTVTYDTQTGTADFGEDGAFIKSSLTTIDNNGSAVAIDMGNGYDGVVSFNVPVVAGSSISDGTIGGELEAYTINQNAEVIATFTNGKQSSVGKIAIYHFGNEQGLSRVSGSRFETSSNSGDPLFRVDANGENIIGADVSNFALENSNINIATGLTDLIILQRSFDANSKLITTADEMMQKALSMDA